MQCDYFANYRSVTGGNFSCNLKRCCVPAARKQLPRVTALLLACTIDIVSQDALDDNMASLSSCGFHCQSEHDNDRMAGNERPEDS